ncbi:MAG: glutamine--fructose-6-phosphate transaminase (isomerizing) [Candidatus Roizmanbacteria bacterium]|nr:MAG: glutamine--fructose-6-phosphate transaminase (isomerizing) [Candidatus Roizmanbacteria bacterium]
MCGIFAYSGSKNNAGDIILEGLKSLEYRGYDSWGVAVKTSDGKIYLEKHIGKIGEARYRTVSGEAHLPALQSSIGIGHTRWATHGGVTEKNAHPHTDCHKKVIVVHNGIVDNYEYIKNKLAKSGHKFFAETDTEVIAHLIEEKMKNKKDLKQIVLESFKELAGLNGIIVFFPETEQFFAIKTGSPLVFCTNNNEQLIASDAVALLPYTKKVYYLEDNELLQISRKTFYLLDENRKEKFPVFMKLTMNKGDAELGKYSHYMIKEIWEQPAVLQNIVNGQHNHIQKGAKIIREAYGTFLVACGSAYISTVAATYLFSKIAKKHLNTSIASEFSYLEHFIKEKSLIIAPSQSGESIDVISSIKNAKEHKAKIMGIINVLGSTLYRLADYCIPLNVGPEKGVAATKSLTAKIVVYYLLAHELNGTYKKGVKELTQAIKETEELLKKHKKIKELSEQLKNHKNLFILGRGVSYPAALESALKIKEVSYIHAEGLAAGELKHGAIALVEKGTPVIVYNPQDETYEDTLSSAHEVTARGAYVIGVSNKNNQVYNEFIKVENCEEATIIPNVVVAQLLGYYLALAKGLDPDKPRNLAKSVTVK